MSADREIEVMQFYVPENRTKNLRFWRKIAEAVIANGMAINFLRTIPFVPNVRNAVITLVFLGITALFVGGIKGVSVTEYFYYFVKAKIVGKKLFLHKPTKEGQMKTSGLALDKSTQDWLRLVGLYKGIAIFRDSILRDFRYMKVMAVEPSSYHLKSETEKSKIIGDFYDWCLNCPSKVNIYISQAQQDASEMIESVEAKNAGKSYQKIEKKDDYVELIKEVTEKRSSKQQFLIVIEYETGEDGIPSTDKDEIAEQLWDAVGEIQMYFAEIGIPIIENNDENFFTAEILYKYLNRGTARVLSFHERINQIYWDAVQIQEIELDSDGEPQEPPFIEDCSYIASNGFNSRSVDYVVVDGEYISFAYIKTTGYKSNVVGGWAGVLSNPTRSNNIDMSIHFVKKNRTAEIAKLKVEKRFTSAMFRFLASKESDHAETFYNSNENSKFIEECLEENKEDLFDTVFLYAIHGRTKREVIIEKHRLEKALRKKSYYLNPCTGMQEEAYRMSLPTGYISSQIMRSGSRNFLTSTMASTFPFIAKEQFDQNGELWGVDSYTGTPVAIDLYNTSNVSNPHVFLFGLSGTGKSYTEQTLAGRMNLNGRKVVFILPIKGHEYKRKCEARGGAYYKLMPGANQCYNIFGILPQAEIDELTLETLDDITVENLLSMKLTFLKTFFSLLKSNYRLDEQEEDALDTSLMELYGKFGITHDDNSIYDKEGNLKIMPTFSDFDNHIKGVEDLGGIRKLIQKFVSGSASNMNGQTDIDLSSDYIVLDVNFDHLDDKLKLPYMLIATDIAYGIAKASLTEPCAVVMDEVWQMMVNKMTADFVIKMPKILRAYATSFIGSTQDIQDLSKTGGAGEAIVNNCDTIIVLRTGPKEIKNIASMVELNDSERATISKFQIGQGLVIHGSTRFSVNFETTFMELYEQNTDPSLRKKLEAEKRRRDLEKEQEWLEQQESEFYKEAV